MGEIVFGAKRLVNGGETTKDENRGETTWGKTTWGRNDLLPNGTPMETLLLSAWLRMLI